MLVFIQLTIKAIKNKNADKLDKNVNELDKKNINNQNKDLIIQNIIKIRRLLSKTCLHVALPGGFLFFILIQSLNFLFPSVLNSIFPPDSHQIITITNNKPTSQDIVLMGRLSYSNKWIPILTSNHNLQLTSIKNIAPSEKFVCNIRTGLKDVDHIIIANVSNGTFNSGNDALAFAVPCNDIYVYTETMGKLNIKPNVHLTGIINYILLYFTGIIGLISLFFILLSKIEKKLIKVILLILPILAVAFIVGFATWLHIKTLFYFI
jgi:hypothetical protein